MSWMCLSVSHMSCVEHNVFRACWLVCVEVLSDTNSVHVARARRSAESLARTREDVTTGMKSLLSELATRKEVRKRETKMVRQGDCVHSDEVTRASNRCWILAFDQQLRNGGTHLRNFCVSEAERKHLFDEVVEIGVDWVTYRSQNGETYDEGASDPPLSSKPTLHLVTDQGPKSWVGIHCLFAIGVRGSVSFDVFHRLHGDWLGAITYAQVATLRTDFRHVLHMWNGPFKSQAHGGKLQEVAASFCSIADESNPVFLVLFDALAHELQMSDATDYGEAPHVRAVWQRLLDVLQKRPSFDTKHARWFSFESKALSMEHEVPCASLLCLLLWYGWQKGMWKTWNELPLNGDKEPSVDCGAIDVAEAADVDQPVQAEGQTEESSWSPRFVKAKHLQLAARVLANPLSVRVFRGIVHLPRSFITAFGDIMQQQHSPWGTETCIQSLCEGRLVELAHMFVGELVSPVFAERIGMHMESSTYCVNDDRVASVMFHLALSAFSAVVLTSMQYTHMLPHAFLRVRSGDVSARGQALNWIEQVWSAIRALEAHAATTSDRDCIAFLRDLRIPQQVWCREMCLLLEVEGFIVKEEFSSSLSKFARGLHSTLMVENSFRKARASERSASGV
eukprot:6470386-Amphidinium_carterae.3